MVFTHSRRCRCCWCRWWSLIVVDVDVFVDSTSASTGDVDVFVDSTSASTGDVDVFVDSTSASTGDVDVFVDSTSASTGDGGGGCRFHLCKYW